MDWLQVFTIIVTLLGGIFYIHSDVKEIRDEWKQQSARTDRLYEMFIDLLKDKNR
jgi:hypothetical protein